VVDGLLVVDVEILSNVVVGDVLVVVLEALLVVEDSRFVSALNTTLLVKLERLLGRVACVVVELLLAVEWLDLVVDLRVLLVATIGLLVVEVEALLVVVVAASLLVVLLTGDVVVLARVDVVLARVVVVLARVVAAVVRDVLVLGLVVAVVTGDATQRLLTHRFPFPHLIPHLPQLLQSLLRAAQYPPHVFEHRLVPYGHAGFAHFFLRQSQNDRTLAYSIDLSDFGHFERLYFARVGRDLQNLCTEESFERAGKSSPLRPFEHP
jgi:hypothetical protein